MSNLPPTCPSCSLVVDDLLKVIGRLEARLNQVCGCKGDCACVLVNRHEAFTAMCKAREQVTKLTQQLASLREELRVEREKHDEEAYDDMKAAKEQAEAALTALREQKSVYSREEFERDSKGETGDNLASLRGPQEPATTLCSATRSVGGGCMGYDDAKCKLPVGHEGKHRDPGYLEWD